MAITPWLRVKNNSLPSYTPRRGRGGGDVISIAEIQRKLTRAYDGIGSWKVDNRAAAFITNCNTHR